jgi:hypothetical protein
MPVEGFTGETATAGEAPGEAAEGTEGPAGLRANRPGDDPLAAGRFADSVDSGSMAKK